MQLAWQLVLNGLVTGSMYAIVALGFAIVFGATRHFHIAHAAVIATGGYVAYILATISELPASLAILAGVLASIAVGVALLRFLYIPLELRHGSTMTIFLASLGMLIFIENVFTMFLGASTRKALYFSAIVYPVEIAGAYLTVAQILLICITIVLTLALLSALKYTRLGQEIRALADNPDLVRSSGRSVNRIKIVVYILASLLAGVAGIYQAGDTGIGPGVTMNLVMFGFIALVAGSVGSIGGAFIAAMALGFIQNVSQLIIAPQWSVPFVFAVFLIFILVLPRGLAESFKKNIVSDSPSKPPTVDKDLVSAKSAKEGD